MHFVYGTVFTALGAAFVVAAASRQSSGEKAVGIGIGAFITAGGLVSLARGVEHVWVQSGQ